MIEVGATVRIMTGKHRGTLAWVVAEDVHGYLVNLGGDKIKRFDRDNIVPVRWYYQGPLGGRNYKSVSGST